MDDRNAHQLAGDWSSALDLSERWVPGTEQKSTQALGAARDAVYLALRWTVPDSIDVAAVVEDLARTPYVWAVADSGLFDVACGELVAGPGAKAIVTHVPLVPETATVEVTTDIVEGPGVVQGSMQWAFTASGYTLRIRSSFSSDRTITSSHEVAMRVAERLGWQLPRVEI